jgi:hypothetical protein
MGKIKKKFLHRSNRFFLFIEKRLFVLADDLIASGPDAAHRTPPVEEMYF